MEKPIQQPQIDLKSTEGMKNAEGGSIFKSGVILRRISKFVAGTDNDAIMPIPIFYDPSTNKILGEGVPVELREELKDELVRSKNIWDWLKQINSVKADPSSFSDKDWELWNSYMIHRFMSMNPDYLELYKA